MKKNWRLGVLAAIGGVLLIGVAKSSNQVELGEVNWGRDYEAALAESERSGKPVLVLFQEVPG